MPYSEEQIAYMRKLGLNLDFSNLSDDDWVRIEEDVGGRLILFGLDENYDANEEGLMCESILDKIPID